LEKKEIEGFVATKKQKHGEKKEAASETAAARSQPSGTDGA